MTKGKTRRSFIKKMALSSSIIPSFPYLISDNYTQKLTFDRSYEFENFTSNDVFPEPIGVLYCKERATYDGLMEEQMEEAQKKDKSKKTLNDLLNAGDTWEVK